MRILVIEDDPETIDHVATGLEELGYAVDRAETGRQGLFLAADGSYDLLIVDRMLPVVDGLTLVRTLRAGQVHTPVLFLTTLGGVFDRVSGLQAGGDDYLVKPFAFAELEARVEALARRARTVATATTLQIADLELDRISRTVRRGGRAIDLQAREFQVLEFLMRHAGQVVTRTMLLEGVWDLHFDPHTNVVESHVSRIRSKVDRGYANELIQTIRGAGYVIRSSS
jgi:two-component system OmpR family response regulator